MSLSFELMREADIPSIQEIVEGFMTFNPEQIKAFLSEKQNMAHIAKLDGTIIGLIYGYSLTRLDGKEPQFFIYSVDIIRSLVPTGAVFADIGAGTGKFTESIARCG